jgi:uncharacterized protein (TIGR02271 family)
MRTDIREGMTVRTRDGQKLGKVLSIAGDGFIIEKGLLFKKDYMASFDRIEEVVGDEVIYMPLSDVDRVEHERADVAAKAGFDERRIPLKEEEVIAGKRPRAAGEVTVTKEVITEEKQVTVPVTREEVVVREGPATGSVSTDARFEGETIKVPVVEEEVVVEKRPVVKREVRVSKERHEEQRTASAKVRREEAHVEGEGRVEKLSSSGRDDLDPDKRKV